MVYTVIKKNRIGIEKITIFTGGRNDMIMSYINIPCIPIYSDYYDRTLRSIL